MERGPVERHSPTAAGAGGYIPAFRGWESRRCISWMAAWDSATGARRRRRCLLHRQRRGLGSGLAYQFGSVIGAETRDYGLNVNLGGNINLTGREPRDGRTFETKGEDPILAGKIAAAHIRAVQDQHVVGASSITR